MPTLTLEEVEKLQKKTENIRNLSIISSKGQGRSALFDGMISDGGIIIHSQSYYVDTRVDSADRTFTVRSGNYLLYHEKESDIPGEKTPFLIDVLKSPTNPRDQFGFISTLRIVDGALFVISSVNPDYTDIERKLIQTLQEKVKPALVITKLNEQILELKLGAEDIYQNCVRIIESFNATISLYKPADMDDLEVHPSKGNVAFGAAQHRWAFTLTTFARIYAKKFHIDESKLMEKLWGENYYDPKSRKWVTSATAIEGETLKRGFCTFIMDPIIKVYNTILSGDSEQLDKMCIALGITLTSDEKEHTGKFLLKTVMSKWMNLADNLLELIVLHLPSPITAQKYRFKSLYQGPDTDEVACGIRDCNPKAPLIVYIAKMVETSERGRFYAVGRVFGGTIEVGKKVNIMGLNYTADKKDDFFIKPVRRLSILNGYHTEALNGSVPCGNIVGVVGIDQYLLKTGTISSCGNDYPLNIVKCSTTHTMSLTVEPAEVTNLPRLIDCLRRLTKADPLISAETDDFGEHCITGCDDFHLEAGIKRLQTDSRIEIKASPPFVIYKETVSAPSSKICIARSPNKHNKVYVSAEPLDPKICDLIEASKMGPKDVREEREALLVDTFNWDRLDAKKIWSFGPENAGPNVLVDACEEIKFMNEIKDSMISAFQWAAKEGALAGENLRSVRMNIVDVSLHSDSIHRGGGQMIPTARRAYLAAQLTAEPKLLEPFFLAKLTAPKEMSGVIRKRLDEKRCVLLEEGPEYLSFLEDMKFYLPVSELKGILLIIVLKSYLTFSFG